MLPVDAAAFVKAALMEAGRPELAPLIYVNRSGYPCVRWAKLAGPPTLDDCAAVCKAFDLWYGGPQELVPGESRWDGYSPAVVKDWYPLAINGWASANMKEAG